MMSNILWIVLFLKISLVHCLLFPLHFKSEVLKSDGGDPGTPLFLTPYVEGGNITEGRQLAAVPFTEEMGIPSYSGFFTVNKTFNSNQFFWYFPPSSAVSKNAPVVVWLQGGPGHSSLLGLFSSNGPLKVVNNTFQHRKTNWAVNHHLIYIDNPVGAGFSFTDDEEEGYCANQTRVGEELYSTVVQFLQLFPELQHNKFYVAGKSYAGKFAPALAYTIHKKNPNAKVKVNLKGLVIASGWCNPEHQVSYSKFLTQIGLDWNQEAILKKQENTIVELIKLKEFEEAYYAWQKLVFTIISMSESSMLNYLNKHDFENKGFNFISVIDQSSIRKQIHVGSLEFSKSNNDVFVNLREDWMQSVAPWLTDLLDYYDVLVYNGQLDVITAYPLAVNYLRNLNFSAANEYELAERRQWKVEGKLAGYVKQAGRLTEVMVRNADHRVSSDQPERALDLITRFTHGNEFPKPE